MVAGLDRVFRCARAMVRPTARHRTAPSVVVRHGPTGRFLAADGTWTERVDHAALIDPADAARVINRLSCEPVFDVVPVGNASAA